MYRLVLQYRPLTPFAQTARLSASLYCIQNPTALAALKRVFLLDQHKRTARSRNITVWIPGAFQAWQNDKGGLTCRTKETDYFLNFKIIRNDTV